MIPFLCALMMLSAAPHARLAVRKSAQQARAHHHVRHKLRTPPVRSLVRGAGTEELKFGIRVLNQIAGEIEVRVQKTAKGRIRRIVAKAGTTGTIGKMFPVHNGQRAEVRADGLHPSLMVQQRDDSYTRSAIKVHFANKHGAPARIVRESAKKGKHRDRRVLPDGVFDALTGFLYFATRKAKVGETYAFPAYSGTTLFIVRVKVAAEEPVWTAALGMKPSFRLEVAMLREPRWAPLPDGEVRVISENPDHWKQSIILWVSAGEPALPLRMKSHYGVLGAVEVSLTSYRRLAPKRRR